MTSKEALAQFEWLADKLAYWSGHDISELDEQYNYSGLLGQVYQALTELEELKQRDTPMKWIDVVDKTGHYDKCPVCGYPSYNDLGHNHFCTVCGQRLEY